MELVRQSFDVWTPITPGRVLEGMQLIEKAGRVCYQSEGKSGVEHCPKCKDAHLHAGVCELAKWHEYAVSCVMVPTCFSFIERILKRKHEAVIEHWSLTISFITDRGVTHELVRHRAGASFCQESTRYCNYGGTEMKFIVPVGVMLTPRDLELLKLIEEHYKQDIAAGCTPQEARYFLPSGLKTQIVTTMNVRELRHMLNLRTSKAAHPQIRALMIELLHYLVQRIPTLFSDLIDDNRE